MNHVKSFFENKTTRLWRLSGKCALRDHMFKAIIDGKPDEVESTLVPYLFHLDEMMADDFDYAKSAMQYLWVQLAARLHGETMLTGAEVYNVQEPYYDRLEQAKTFADLKALYVEQALEFANLIAAKNESASYSDLTKACMTFVRENLYQKVTVSQVAEAMHFSRSYISHCFREDTGRTLYAFIQDEKILEAKNLLRTNIPLATIAQMLGFTSQSHFTQVMKRETGLTPRQLRELERE